MKVNKDAEEDPKVREDAAAWFKRMEDGDEEALKNWRVWRELSIKKYEEEYARLNVHFDEYTGESKVGPETMDAAVKRLQEMGLIEEDNGALRINLEKYKLGKAVVRKRGACLSLPPPPPPELATTADLASQSQTGRPSTSPGTSARRSSGTRSTSSTR